jgi:LAS seventeen-binding protein 5
MTFEQLDRSIDADSDSEDEAAEQAHLYRSKYCSPLGLLVSRILTATVAVEKGKETANASHALAGLHISSGSTSLRPKAPPRPVQQQPVDDDSDEGDIEEEDENDPFADRNAV